MDILGGILAALVVAATPLIFAAIGELVVERAGVLNLGVEGMMIIGAIAGFAGTLTTGSPFLGFLFAVLCSSLLACLFGILTQTLLANQVATGLALTIFGLGVSALVGQRYTGNSLPTFPRLHLPVLSDIPVLGAALFSQDVLVYLSIALTAAVWWTLGYTRLGLVLRHPSTVGKHEAEIDHPPHMPGIGSLAEPARCSRLVLRRAPAVSEHQPEAIHGPVDIRLGGLAEPTHSFRLVLRRSAAVPEHEAEIAHGPRVPRLGGLAEEPYGLGLIFRHAATVPEQET